MKNKTAIIAAAIVLLVVLGGGLLIVRNMSRSTPEIPEEEELITDLPPADPSITVDVSRKADGKAVIMTISKIPQGTDSIEYELSYTTGEGLPKGALGKIDVSGKSEIEKEVLLGTCSKNTCTYDTGVTAVQLVLKFNSAEGSTQLTKDFSLE